MPKTFDGVITYDILPDGCLNGVYSNDHPDTKNKICNEIARKITDDTNDTDALAGKYVCVYIDPDNSIGECTLVIHTRPVKRRNGQYHFEWYNKSNQKIYEGSGWRIRDNQITVSYKDVVN